MFVPSASLTTDTDSILPSCLAFSQMLNSKPLMDREHTKTLPSVITQAGVTLPVVSQSPSLLWETAKCYSPEMRSDELKTSVMCWFCGYCEVLCWSSTRTQIVSKRNGFYLPKEHDIRALKRGQMNKTN